MFPWTLFSKQIKQNTIVHNCSGGGENWFIHSDGCSSHSNRTRSDPGLLPPCRRHLRSICREWHLTLAGFAFIKNALNVVFSDGGYTRGSSCSLSFQVSRGCRLANYARLHGSHQFLPLYSWNCLICHTSIVVYQATHKLKHKVNFEPTSTTFVSSL